MDMRNVNDIVRTNSELDRIPMIEALICADSDARSLAQRGRSAKRYSGLWQRAEEAASHTARFGRIIYFLRFRSPASGATAEDLELCEMLAQKLEAKGQWRGEYSL
jgi:hypothetical protein